jgi:hypothetical protein
MTDKTATQNLTRTQSTDDPRKVATYLKTLAVEVDQRMAAQYSEIARAQVPPAAIVRVLNPYAIHSNDVGFNVVFDTVELDTAGLVDLSVNPKVINLGSPGYWVVGAYAECTGWPTASGDMLLFLLSGGSSRTAGFHDGNLSFVSGSVSVIESTSAPLTEQASLGVTFTGTMPGGAEGSQLLYAEMWAYKVRDL